jgi:drug/metabolite transporter (DMT)-like permease
MNFFKANNNLAICWMLVAICFFCLLAIASRELTDRLSTVDILFWRSLLGFIIISAWLFGKNSSPLKGQTWSLFGWHMLRNVCHFAGQCAWLIAIAAIPLAEVFALEFTTPLWAALMASFFLREQTNRFRVLALLMGLVGVLVILQPGAAVIHPASLVMLVGAIGFAVSIVTTRKITLVQSTQANSVLIILFFMTAMQLLISIVWLQGEVLIPDLIAWPWLCAITLSALGAHYCFTKALSLADAAVVLPVDYLRLPLISVLAWYLYDEHLNVQLSIGALLIIGGNAVSLYGERKREAETTRYPE